MRSLRRSVEFWESLPLADPQHLYNLACAHAQYYGLIDGRRQPLLPEEKAERESHAERSITALRRAVASGFVPPSWVSRDRDLDPLRSRDDFRALLMDLTFPAQPFASPPAIP
jgi:eukaryotic-like serine/threonine-protein kinase